MKLLMGSPQAAILQQKARFLQASPAEGIK